MKSLKVLASVLVFAAALGCEREIQREEPLGIESGITQESGLTRDYCAGLAAGGIVEEERVAYERCRAQGLVE